MAKKSKREQARESAAARGNESIAEARRLLNKALFNSQTARDAFAEGALLTVLQALSGAVSIQVKP